MPANADEARARVASEEDGAPSRSPVLRAALPASPQSRTLSARASFVMPPPRGGRVLLRWDSVSVRVPPSKRGGEPRTVLHGVRGHAAPTELVAIMGPSGAGKTTLLHALSWRCEGAVSGNVYVNETRVTRGLPSAGFVSQDDRLYARLTVRETLRVAADLLMPSDASAAQRDERVSSVLEQLRLHACADTRVGDSEERGISGGERRRVVIGEVLVANPALLFLDEPTTGLDAATSLGVVSVLRRLARGGRTIVCTIHQPRPAVFAAFDRVILLAEGRVLYAGHPSNVVAHFAALSPLAFPCPDNVSVSDFLLDITAPVRRTDRAELSRRVVYLARKWDEADAAAPPPPLLPAPTLLPATAHAGATGDAEQTAGMDSGAARCCACCRGSHREPFANGWARQFGTLATRSWRNYMRDPTATVVALAQNVGLAVLIGLIFLQLPLNQTAAQNRAGVLFFMLLYQSFSGMTVVLNMFIVEIPIVSKERAAHAYRISAYACAKMLTELLIEVANPVVFSAVAYWIVGLHANAERFFTFLGVDVLAALCASSFAMFVGAASRSLPVSNIVVPGVAIIMMLFAGFFVAEDTIPDALSWISYLSFFRFAFRAMVVTELRGESFVCNSGANCTASAFVAGLYTCSDELTKPCVPTGNLAAEILGFESVEVWREVVALACMIVGYRLLTYVMLRFVGRPAWLGRALSPPLATAATAASDGASFAAASGPGVAVPAAASDAPAPTLSPLALDGELVPSPPTSPHGDAAGAAPSVASLRRHASVDSPLGSYAAVSSAAPASGLASGGSAVQLLRSATDGASASAYGSAADLSVADADVVVDVPASPPVVPPPLRTFSSLASREAVQHSVTLEWRSVTCTIATSAGACCGRGRTHTVKHVLRDCAYALLRCAHACARTFSRARRSGVARPGELLAIMGASGAGKTSLLSVLAQRGSGTVHGEFLVNGHPMPADTSGFLGFVTQEDTLQPLLTVHETLEFAAQLLLPRTMSADEQRQRVEAVIDELGLRKVANARVGSPEQRGLSGGERRRLSIAEVLVANPSLLFLDEPTSGLDAATSLSLFSTLRSLARRGRTIVCTVHQPRTEIFALFDKLLVLARGSPVYLGEAAAVIPYLASLQPTSFTSPPHTNPADFLLDLMTPTRTSEREAVDARVTYLIDACRKAALTPADRAEKGGDASFASADSTEPPRPPLRAGFCPQFRLLSKRMGRTLLRSYGATLVRVLQTVLVSLLLGFVYFQLGTSQQNVRDRQGIIFFLLMFQATAGLGTVVTSLQADRAAFKRERSAGMYSPLAAYLARVLAELPLDVLMPVVTCAILYFIANLNPGVDRFFIFVGLNVLVTLASSSVTFVLSIASPNVLVAIIVAPVSVTVLSLFGGFFNNTNTLPVYLAWIEYLSYMKFAFAGLAVNEFSGTTMNCTGVPVCAFPTGADVLSNLGFSSWNVWVSAVVLVGMIVVWRVVAYVLLHVLVRDRFAVAQRPAPAASADAGQPRAAPAGK